LASRIVRWHLSELCAPPKCALPGHPDEIPTHLLRVPTSCTDIYTLSIQQGPPKPACRWPCKRGGIALPASTTQELPCGLTKSQAPRASAINKPSVAPKVKSSPYGLDITIDLTLNMTILYCFHRASKGWEGKWRSRPALCWARRGNFVRLGARTRGLLHRVAAAIRF